MADRLATMVGFIVGAALIVFGITWPDHLSNYYVYEINKFEKTITELKESEATRSEIKTVEDQLRDYKDSWAAGFTRFLDIKSVMIVLGGAYAATLIAFPFRRAIRSLMSVIMVFARERQEEEFEIVYDRILDFADYRYRKELIPDEKIAAVPLYFLRDAMNNFIQVDYVSEEMVEEIVNSEIEGYNFQQDREIAVMEYMARAAPAFGMLGTVVGLILLLGRVAGGNSNIADIMGVMSVALITTLYGVLFAQLVFLPVATKLTRNKESYSRLYEMIREGILYLHRRERPDVVEQDMQIYLSRKKRSQIRNEKKAAMARGDLNL